MAAKTSDAVVLKTAIFANPHAMVQRVAVTKNLTPEKKATVCSFQIIVIYFYWLLLTLTNVILQEKKFSREENLWILRILAKFKKTNSFFTPENDSSRKSISANFQELMKC